MKKHADITTSIIVDQERNGELEGSVDYLREICPKDVRTRVQAREEIAIAGGSAVLAGQFGLFRGKYLDRLFGKNREPYNLGEAKRFAAAVRYDIDLDEEWVGPPAE
jgi:hypothetical protein